MADKKGRNLAQAKGQKKGKKGIRLKISKEQQGERVHKRRKRCSQKKRQLVAELQLKKKVEEKVGRAERQVRPGDANKAIKREKSQDQKK